ncbi:MAG: hypothetical protein JXA13_13820 [Anaerolineales bacterium]|nr:hypothetical protein [Anaerolineales bacterium]
MIYAHAHDQTEAEDYFAAMEKAEKMLEIAPEEQQDNYYDVNVLEKIGLVEITEQLFQPELCFNERLNLVNQLLDAFGVV